MYYVCRLVWGAGVVLDRVLTLVTLHRSMSTADTGYQVTIQQAARSTSAQYTTNSEGDNT